MPNGARLWWVQHGSPQGVPQETAACTWPCETSRRCTSSGGIIVDSNSNVGESQQEAESVFSQSLCTTPSPTGTYNSGPSSSGSNSGNFVPQRPINGGSSSSSGSGANYPGAGSSTGNVGPTYPAAGATGGASSIPSGPSPSFDGKFIRLMRKFLKQDFNSPT
jgi:hypothetical protein